MFSKTYLFSYRHRSSTLGTLRCNWFFNLNFLRFSSFHLILQIKISFKNFLLEFRWIQICNVRSWKKYSTRLVKLSRFDVLIFNSKKLNSFCFIQFLTIISQDLFFVWVVCFQNLLIYYLFTRILRVNIFSRSWILLSLCFDSWSFLLSFELSLSLGCIVVVNFCLRLWILTFLLKIFLISRSLLLLLLLLRGVF